jgi:hypothetical protein
MHRVVDLPDGGCLRTSDTSKRISSTMALGACFYSYLQLALVINNEIYNKSFGTV